MNAQFKAKLLQKLAAKKSNKGFTLIELLVVVIIVGVLAAVALPNLLGQVGKGRETAAKTGAGAINRAQQAYHFERQEFSPNLADADLEANNALGVIVKSDIYTFDVVGGPNPVATVTAQADNVKDGTRSYSGATTFDGATGVYDNILCQSDEIGAAAAAPADATACPGAYTEVK